MAGAPLEEKGAAKNGVAPSAASKAEVKEPEVKEVAADAEGGEEGELSAVDEEWLDRAFKVLESLEEYCSGPDFTAALSEFFTEHLRDFDGIEELEEGDDMPAEWYSIFLSYLERMDTKVEEFITGTEIAGGTCSSDEVFGIIQHFNELGVEWPSTCVDYLIACTEYTNFLQMIVDHRAMFGLNPNFDPDALEEGDEGEEGEEEDKPEDLAAVEKGP